MDKIIVYFQEYDYVSIKEIDSLYSFSILYHNKWSQRNIVHQSEFVVLAACRGLKRVCLKKINDKDYLYIIDDICDSVSYSKEIDIFLSLQCEGNSPVTPQMLFHAILDSTNELHPKMRLSDIFYNYKYINGLRPKKIKIDIFTDKFDNYLSNGFPKNKETAITNIMHDLNMSEADASLLFNRWQEFYFIDCHPYYGWMLCHPYDLLTIEQFKEKMSVECIEFKLDNNTGIIHFFAGEIQGKVLTKDLPKYPVIALFITIKSGAQWLLINESSNINRPVIAKF